MVELAMVVLLHLVEGVEVEVELRVESPLSPQIVTVL